eukprot:scaffold2229_cov413-Prasinococcus_capsulatus_cf.AAC.15
MWGQRRGAAIRGCLVSELPTTTGGRRGSQGCCCREVWGPQDSLAAVPSGSLADFVGWPPADRNPRRRLPAQSSRA